MQNLSESVKTLENCYAVLNEKLFNNSIKQSPLITIQTKGRKSAYGWFWADKWKEGKEVRPELNVSAEYLSRPAEEILLTLAHEMVHTYAHQEGIKDTSREGRWHNKKFAELASRFGMTGPEKPDSSIGYSGVTWKEATLEFIKGLDQGLLDALKLCRMGEGATAKGKGKMLLWECNCGVKLRSGRKDLNILCQDCDGAFSLQGGGE